LAAGVLIVTLGAATVTVKLLVVVPPESSRASIVIACDPGLNARVVFSELPPVWYFKAPLAYTSIVCTGLWPPAFAIQASAGGHSPVHTMLVYAPLAYPSIVCTGLLPLALDWMANGNATVAFHAGVLEVAA